MGITRHFGTTFVLTLALLTAGCGQSAVERGFDILELEVVAGTRGISPTGGALAVAPDGRAAAFVADSAWRIVMPETGEMLEPGVSDAVRKLLDRGHQMVPPTARWITPRRLQVCTDYAVVLSLDLDTPTPEWDHTPSLDNARGSCRPAGSLSPSDGMFVRAKATGGEVTIRRARDDSVLATLRAPMFRSLRAIHLSERTDDTHLAALTLEEVLGGFSSRRHTLVVNPAASGTTRLFFTRPALFKARVSAGSHGPQIWGLARCGDGEWCLWRGEG